MADGFLWDEVIVRQEIIVQGLFEFRGAVEAASLRTAMESRDRTLAVFGSLADEGDRELVWQVAVRAKERIEQHLRQLARRHLKNHNPEQVAAWIMAWTPEKATGVPH